MSDNNVKKNAETTLATLESKEAANALRQLLLSEHRGCQLWIYIFNKMVDDVSTYEVAVANSFGGKLSELVIERLKQTTDVFLDVLTAPSSPVMDEIAS